jgi:hypothetical protein
MSLISAQVERLTRAEITLIRELSNYDHPDRPLPDAVELDPRIARIVRKLGLTTFDEAVNNLFRRQLI